MGATAFERIRAAAPTLSFGPPRGIVRGVGINPGTPIEATLPLLVAVRGAGR